VASLAPNITIVGPTKLETHLMDHQPSLWKKGQEGVLLSVHFILALGPGQVFHVSPCMELEPHFVDHRQYVEATPS